MFVAVFMIVAAFVVVLAAALAGDGDGRGGEVSRQI